MVDRCEQPHLLIEVVVLRRPSQLGRAGHPGCPRSALRSSLLLSGDPLSGLGTSPVQMARNATTSNAAVWLVAFRSPGLGWRLLPGPRKQRSRVVSAGYYQETVLRVAPKVSARSRSVTLVRPEPGRMEGSHAQAVICAPVARGVDLSDPEGRDRDAHVLGFAGGGRRVGRQRPVNRLACATHGLGNRRWRLAVGSAAPDFAIVN